MLALVPDRDRDPCSCAHPTRPPRTRRLGRRLGREAKNRRFRLPIAHLLTIKNMPLSRQKTAWPDPDSNWGHHDFQSCALPTELSGRGRLMLAALEFLDQRLVRGLQPLCN